jgi:putative oxidoreductase
MLTAIRTVHWKNGPWAANGGYEFNLVLIAALLGLADDGPGDLSLDHILGIRKAGPEWALAALALAAAASTLTVELGRRTAAKATDESPPAAPVTAGDPATAD